MITSPVQVNKSQIDLQDSLLTEKIAGIDLQKTLQDLWNATPWGQNDNKEQGLKNSILVKGNYPTADDAAIGASKAIHALKRKDGKKEIFGGREVGKIIVERKGKYSITPFISFQEVILNSSGIQINLML